MKLFLPVTFSVLIAVGSAFAQTPTQQPAPSQQQRDDQGVTVTGCLTKGSAANQYVIADSKSGEKFTFEGPDKLDTYVNQTVQLTGKMMDRGGEKSFQPQAVKSISASCEKNQ